VEAAAIGVPDAKWGERPMMLVVLAPPNNGGDITPEILKDHMKKCADQGRIPRYAVPDKYIITDSIPKTSVGKIDKKVIRTLYAHA
jgi:fatty-acyl-CoA synthase